MNDSIALSLGGNMRRLASRAQASIFPKNAPVLLVGIFPNPEDHTSCGCAFRGNAEIADSII